MAGYEERSLARKMFKCRVIPANAWAFQELFWDVMKSHYGDAFAAVAPQGRKGDGGNDGYHPQNKHYYQVFGPVDPLEKAGSAATKLAADFTKVKDVWGVETGPGLLKFSFVFNDKYLGAPRDVELALNELRAKNSSITFSQYCCRELEDDFMQLPATEWDRVLGGAVPNPKQIGGLDYGVLAEVIHHVMSADVDASDSRLALPPELDHKIRLTGLGSVSAIHIQSGALLAGHIERFFRANSNFALHDLRNHVVGVYETARKVIGQDPTDAEARPDAVFSLFRRTLFPKHATTAMSLAVDAVIGYFFEACDVFDPAARKDLPGAAP